MSPPSPPALPGAPERVTFPGEARSRPSAAALVGLLYRPRPESPAPRPAVALLHGCGGLYARAGEVQPKLRFWAEHLAMLGYVTLLVDSFGPRGIDETCTGRHRLGTETDRADDARGALRYLQRRPDVRSDRVGLVGWSNGASATLSVLFDQGDPEADYRAAVAFYPNCLRRYPGAPDHRPYAPLLVLVGAADDWTPAALCRAWAERARALGAPMDIHVYPGAHHAFDAPDTPLRYRHEVKNRSKPEGVGGAHVGTDPLARADAIVRVSAFLECHLDGG